MPRWHAHTPDALISVHLCVTQMLAKIKRASLADTKVTLSEHPRKALFQDTHAAVAQAASGHELHKPMLSYLSFSGSQDITAQASTIHPGHFGPPVWMSACVCVWGFAAGP